MLTAAQAAAGPMRLVAVTVLTSHSARELARVLGRSEADPAVEVERLARLVEQSGLAGVVASPMEVAHLRRALGPRAWIVVPGIRPGGSPVDDQARTASVREAVHAGATHLVVGRPITRAAEPGLVYQAMSEEATA
jgi:orotidine-5'-phosphate decarboxylase